MFHIKFGLNWLNRFESADDGQMAEVAYPISSPACFDSGELIILKFVNVTYT